MNEDFSFPGYAGYARKCGEKSVFTEDDFNRWVARSYSIAQELTNLLNQEYDNGRNGNTIRKDPKLRDCAKEIIREFQSLYFDFMLKKNSESSRGYSIFALNYITQNDGPISHLVQFCSDAIFPTEFRGDDKELGKIVDYKNRMKLKAELSKIKLNSSQR